MALAVILLVGAAIDDPHLCRFAFRPAWFRSAPRSHHANFADGGRYDSTAKSANLRRQVLDRIEALPGVRRPRPAQSCRWTLTASTCLSPSQAPRFPKALCIAAISSGVTSVRITSLLFGFPCYADAFFDRRDTENSARVLIINQAFAKKYWPKGDPIGAEITIGKGLGAEFDEPAASNRRHRRRHAARMDCSTLTNP